MNENQNHNNASIALPGGRSLAIADQTRALRIHDPQGAIELEIDLRDTGPVVHVRAAALQVETQGELSFGCERFEVRARDSICLASVGDLRMTSDGDVTASAGGDLDLRAGGHTHCEGNAVRIRARTGEAQIEARDSVRLEGERVLLNR